MSQTPAEKFFWRKDPTVDENQQITTPRVTVEKGSPQDKEETAKKSEPKPASVLVGIPCHNSETSIGRTIVKVLPLGGLVLVCDDGSSDLTEEIATKMGCLVIKHPRELGRSDSVTSIYIAAKKLKAEVLLTVGIDSNFSLTDATRLLDAVQKEDVDIAIGSNNDREAVERARNEGRISDRGSMFRAYSRRALAMISPAGTGSVVVEKEVLEFADQQGLRTREYPTTVQRSHPEAVQAVVPSRFDMKYMDYVAIKHPLVFLGIPSIGLLYGAVLETLLNTNFAGSILSLIPRFAVSLVSSPMFVGSVALSIGTAVLYSQKKILAKVNGSSRKVERL